MGSFKVCWIGNQTQMFHFVMIGYMFQKKDLINIYMVQKKNLPSQKNKQKLQNKKLVTKY